ncbi:MAG: hypothetical protein Unbinned1693contig1002_6 [Prokaryotic dsDNA virus sp.]|jgi:hypothetical protein|nr:MAG: hypothetical protein Unbinned1693contig1002_6 [Prokaryotic dsDNA virus sp.]|tara:strand:+ start:11507 stop:11641 length:135 start_codon:yes stop_codon:yes gene_type:complete
MSEEYEIIDGKDVQEITIDKEQMKQIAESLTDGNNTFTFFVTKE